MLHCKCLTIFRNAWILLLFILNIISKIRGIIMVANEVFGTQLFFGFAVMLILEYIDWSVIFYCRTGSFSLILKWLVRTWYNLLWLNWCYCPQVVFKTLISKAWFDHLLLVCSINSHWVCILSTHFYGPMIIRCEIHSSSQM